MIGVFASLEWSFAATFGKGRFKDDVSLKNWENPSSACKVLWERKELSPVLRRVLTMKRTILTIYSKIQQCNYGNIFLQGIVMRHLCKNLKIPKKNFVSFENFEVGLLPYSFQNHRIFSFVFLNSARQIRLSPCEGSIWRELFQKSFCWKIREEMEICQLPEDLYHGIFPWRVSVVERPSVKASFTDILLSFTRKSWKLFFWMIQCQGTPQTSFNHDVNQTGPSKGRVHSHSSNSFFLSGD